MMATLSAKDGPPMFSDWLSQTRRAQPAASSPDNARSLADGILQLCTLCEEMLILVAIQEAARPLLHTVPERIEAVRACAHAIRAESDTTPGATGDDPYSLLALSRWVWHED